MPLDSMTFLCKLRSSDLCFIRYSLFSIMNTDIGTIILLSVNIVCALMVILGHRRPLLFWIIIALQSSFKIRYFTALNGGDGELTWVLIWSSFLPYDRTKKTNATHWSMVLFLINVIAFYFYAGSSKTGELWASGRGVWAALQFDFMVNPGFENLKNITWLMRLLNHLTLTIETFGAFGLLVTTKLPKVRLLLVCCFMIFHLALGVVFNSFPMPQIGILIWLLFLPSIYIELLAPKNLLQFISGREIRSTKIAAIEKIGFYFASALCVLYLFVGASSIRVVRRRSEPIRLSERFFKSLGISAQSQYFAPDSPHHTGWFVFLGKTQSNETFQVDLINGTVSSTLHFEKPALRTSIYENRNWSKFFFNVTREAHPGKMTLRPICHRYPQFESVEVVYFEERLYPERSGMPLSLSFSSRCESWRRGFVDAADFSPASR